MSLYYGMSPAEIEEKRLSMIREHYEQAIQDIDIAPFWQWVSIIDPSTCPECVALDGKVFRHDDPIWQRYLKRLHKGCRCSFRELSERDIKKRKLTVISSADL